jgi:hypothetical protein
VTDPLAPLLELPGVTDAVADARAAVDSLLGNRVLRHRSADVSAESALRGAWASAVLAGTDVTLADVRGGAAADNPVVQGALRAQAAIPALADTWPRAPRQVLARLHVLAAADLVGPGAADTLGRPTRGAERLDTLAAVLGATSAPAVVVAAVVHGEVAALDAFAPASGVVARTAARLVLIDRGLDPKSLVVVEAGHLELVQDYRAALTAYATGTPDGLAQWLRHCAAAVAAGAREAVAIGQALARA